MPNAAFVHPRVAREKEVSGMRIVGIILIVLGIAGVAYGGFSWTRQKTVLDAGPVTVKTDKRESLPIPPIVGGICLVGGVVLVVTAKR